MFVSMIIPVYNVEKYIHKCLTSVANQSYKDLEVIIVNDGSPDNSQIIIDEFCKSNANFHSYITENHGLGGARNFGISKAKGDYLCFLDSDDYIADSFLEKMVNTALKEKSDIVVCNTIDVYEENGYEEVNETKHGESPITLFQEPQILFNRVSAWGKIYKKTLFNDFAYVSREWYEDMRLTPKLYALADKISYVDEPLQYYIIREGSIMNSNNAHRNLEIIDAFEDLRTYFIEKGTYKNIKNELDFLMVDHILVSAVTRILFQKDNRKNEIIQKLKEYALSYESINKNPYISNMPRNRKIIYYCNRYDLYFITKILIRAKQKTRV